MGVKQGSKIPLEELEVRKNRLMAIKNKTAKQLKELRQVIFAINAKSKFNHPNYVISKKAIK